MHKQFYSFIISLSYSLILFAPVTSHAVFYRVEVWRKLITPQKTTPLLNAAYRWAINFGDVHIDPSLFYRVTSKQHIAFMRIASQLQARNKKIHALVEDRLVIGPTPLAYLIKKCSQANIPHTNIEFRFVRSHPKDFFVPLMMMRPKPKKQLIELDACWNRIKNNSEFITTFPKYFTRLTQKDSEIVNTLRDHPNQRPTLEQYNKMQNFKAHLVDANIVCNLLALEKQPLDYVLTAAGNGHIQDIAKDPVNCWKKLGYENVCVTTIPEEDEEDSDKCAAFGCAMDLEKILAPYLAGEN